MEQKWSQNGANIEKNERKNLSKSSEARWNIWGKSKNKSNRSLRKIIETPREKLRNIPGRSIENLKKIVWKSMRNRYRGEVFIKTVRGRGFHWNGTGTRFSLKRYGGETFGYSWETPGECVGTFPWEFVRQKRSNYRLHRSTRMQNPLQNRASRSMSAQVLEANLL